MNSKIRLALNTTLWEEMSSSGEGNPVLPWKEEWIMLGPSLRGMGRAGEGKYSSPSLYSVCPFPNKWGKKDGFQTANYSLLNICINTWLFNIFQNHNEWAETWTNTVEIVLLINLVTGLTQKSTFMLELHLEARSAIQARCWHKLCQSFIYCVSAKNAPSRHPTPQGASRGCWWSRASQNHMPSWGQDTL